MQKILGFVNENWEIILKAFDITLLKEKKEILNFQNSILLVSEDKREVLGDILQKIEEREIILAELPAHSKSQFEIEDIERLISKVLGFSLK